MPSNQREIQRRDKRLKKDKKNRIIIWSVIAVIIAILIVMKVCEVNVNSLKDYFTDEDGNFTLTQGVVDDNYPYSIDSSGSLTLMTTNNKMCILSPTSLTVLNSKDASVSNSFDHGYSNPVLKIRGTYTFLYDQGETSYRLDLLNDTYYESETQDNILCGDVAKDGTIVLATSSGNQKSLVTVYSKSLKEKLEYTVDFGYIISITINDSASKIAFAAVNSENAKLKTAVYVMSVGTGDVKGEVDMPDGNLIDLHFSSSQVFAVGDSYVGIIKNNDTYNDLIDSDSTVNIADFTYTTSNDLVYAYNSYENSIDNEISVFSSRGKIKSSFTVSGTIKDLSASSNMLTVLTSNEILNYSLSSGELKSSATADDSLKAICRLGSNVFVVKQSTIERIEAD